MVDILGGAPGRTTEPGSTTDALIGEARARMPERLSARDLAVSGLLSAAFLAAAVGLALASPEGGRHPGVVLVVAFGAAYAACSCIDFEVSSGTGVPTMLVLVPMLFALPPGWVPLVVAAGLLAGGAWEWRRGALHPERGLVLLSGAWHAVGPALVLALDGAPDPHLSDWPTYTAALAAQFGFDLASTGLRERIAFGVPARVLAPALARVWTIDLLLAPVAFLAALATLDDIYAWLLVLPAAALLAEMARDRRGRITEALWLAHAYRTVDREAHRDALTGVGNRLAWDEAVALADSQGSEPVSVIIADLDGLKRTNDEHGHEAGDALIRAAADTIRGEVRESDLVARLGGDEFGVLLAGASRERCRLTARRIARALSDHPPVRGVRLAASLGWAATPEVATVSEAERVADQRMYHAKQAHLATRDPA
ncbi:MAG TPA: GGDEF domain-containing protein [Gaiellales bacterium]|nr:GGDEF domain-containing protein [Gaiellales bacterium]